MSNQGPNDEKIKLLLCVCLSISETVCDVMWHGLVWLLMTVSLFQMTNRE